MSTEMGIGSAACQTCRARHYDCDKTQPVCIRCSESGRECVPAFNVRFKRRRNISLGGTDTVAQEGFKFSETQPWVETNRTSMAAPSVPSRILLSYKEALKGVLIKGVAVNFINETPASLSGARAAERASGIDVESVSTPASTSSIAIKQQETPNESLDGRRAPPKVEGQAYLQPQQNVHRGGSATISIPDLLCHPSTDTSSPAYSIQSHGSSQISGQRRGKLYVESSESALTDHHHVELLQHFKNVVGRVWFDIEDPFTAEAVRLAPRCPLLLYSILATAATHKSRFAHDNETADRYAAEAERFHEECVGLLLPMLHDKESITDGAFLACSTILRFYEEISAPVHGKDDARHLLGGYASVETMQSQTPRMTGLMEAAFWVHQRQDVYNAILNQRLPRTDLLWSGLDRSASPAAEHVWAKRATCLNADVVEFCFAGDSSIKHYHKVIRDLDAWHTNKPDTFNPVYYRPADPAQGRFFPDICMMKDVCAFGLSYYYLCMLLMAVYDPTVPRMGKRILEGKETIRRNVLEYLRILCGLSCSNPVPPARVVTCLAISQCGTWVTDPAEQNAIVEVLRQADREDAWPCFSNEKQITEQWAQLARG